MTIDYAQYGRSWREANKERLKNDRILRYHTIGKYKYHRRRMWLNKYKEAKGCSECGYNGHAVAIDFDHNEPKTKKFNISQRLAATPLISLFNEMRKCRLLCANCHRIKTLQERQFDPLPRTK